MLGLSGLLWMGLILPRARARVGLDVPFGGPCQPHGPRKLQQRTRLRHPSCGPLPPARG